MRFRTGFRIFVVGLGLAAAGAVLTRFVWDGFFWLAAAGIGLAIWFSRPSDWRKTWPGDFPITARLLGHHPVPDDRPPAPDFWETAPADKRLRQSMVGVLLGAGLIAWGATDPTDFGGYGSPGWLLLLGLLTVPIASMRAWRAWHDRAVLERGRDRAAADVDSR